MQLFRSLQQEEHPELCGRFASKVWVVALGHGAHFSVRINDNQEAEWRPRRIESRDLLPRIAECGKCQAVLMRSNATMLGGGSLELMP